MVIINTKDAKCEIAVTSIDITGQFTRMVARFVTRVMRATRLRRAVTKPRESESAARLVGEDQDAPSWIHS